MRNHGIYNARLRNTTRKEKEPVQDPNQLSSFYTHCRLSRRDSLPVPCRLAPFAVVQARYTSLRCPLDNTSSDKSASAIKARRMDKPCTITESGAEKDIGICEEAFFEGNDNELTALESGSEELANMLGVG